MESSSWIDSSLSLSLNFEIPNFKIKNSEEKMSEELNQAKMENKKLTEMLTSMYESYIALQTHVADLMNKSTKRKSPESGGGGGGDGVQTDQSSSSSEDESNVFKKPRTNVAIAGVISRKPSSRVLLRTDKSDTTLIVKDGYQWRKYGQKVTRDNPCPRAYFKCSFAPACQVKKKVQRSAEDQTMLVATYDGEHNHPPPSEIDPTSQRNTNSTPCATNSVASSKIIESKPVVTLDLIKPVDGSMPNRTCSSGSAEVHNRSMFQQFVVEQMMSSLTNDPSFKAAVAAAISGRMMDSNNGMVKKWL